MQTLTSRSVVVLVLLLGALACHDAIEPLPLTQFSSNVDEYEVVDLGTFDGAFTQGLALNDRGVTYGRYGEGTAQRSFRWTERAGYQAVGGLDGRPFLGLNLNNQGLVSGNIPAGDGRARPAAYVPRVGFVYLDAADHRGTARGLNDQGEIAGARSPAAGGPSQAFVWTLSGGLRLVPVALPATTGTLVSSAAVDVNNPGAVVGTVTYRLPPSPEPTRPQIRAFVWDARNGTRLIPPFGTSTFGLTYISDHGVVLGASQMRAPQPGDVRANVLSPNPGTIPVHAWKWSEQTGVVDLGTLGGEHSVAWNMDREGNIYGWASDVAGARHAVKWTRDGRIVKLGTLSGNSFSGGVNNHGVVAGWSIAADGQAHAVHFVPKHR